MKKLIVLAIIVFIGINGFLFIKLKDLFNGGQEVVSEQTEETAAKKYAAVTEEEKQYFINETLPYYEHLALSVDEVWIPYWKEGSEQVLAGEISLIQQRLNLQKLVRELELILLKVPNVPVEQLSKPVKETVAQSIVWFEDFVAKRLEAATLMQMGLNNTNLANVATEKFTKAIDDSDASLIKSTVLLYALVYDLQLENETKQIEPKKAIESVEETEETIIEESSTIASVETSNKVNHPALRQYIDDFDDIVELEVQRYADHAYELRMSYTNGKISLHKAVLELDAAYATADEFFLADYYTYENLNAYEEHLLAKLREELKHIYPVYLDYIFAQKRLVFALANERGDIEEDPEGYTDEDYGQFKTEALETIETTLYEINEFKKRVRTLVE